MQWVSDRPTGEWGMISSAAGLPGSGTPFSRWIEQPQHEVEDVEGVEPRVDRVRPGARGPARPEAP